MKLEQQVCSLDLAKRLKELGVKQEYQPYDAYWVKLSAGEWRLLFLETQEDPPTQTPFEHCRAFTVAELGEMLPKGVIKDGQYHHPYTYPEVQYKKNRTEYDSVGFWCVYFGANRTGFIYNAFALTEADARAKMLIYLLENKPIDA